MPVANINVMCGESDTKYLQKRLQESCFCPLYIIVYVHVLCLVWSMYMELKCMGPVPNL